MVKFPLEKSLPYPVSQQHAMMICLAILVKGKKESIAELLFRLDLAVQKAWDEEIFTDEINE